jgi:hypothetical protein
VRRAGATKLATSPARKRVQRGVATSDVLVSSHVGTNADLFPKVLALHVPRGSKVADVTYGEGVFWRDVPAGAWELLASDLKRGVDCRELPYRDGSIDCVVLDPPYMEGLFRRATGHLAGSGSHAAFRARYSDGRATPDEAANDGEPPAKWHDAVVKLYREAAVEAARVLRDEGVLILKCQDEVSANKQRLTHVELVNALAPLGFLAKDLFVLTRPNRPAVSRLLRQVHARKNHSYFLVFVKRRARARRAASR